MDTSESNCSEENLYYRQWTSTNNQNLNLHCLFYYTTVQNTMQKMLHGVKYIKDNKSKTLVNNYYSKRIKAKYLPACTGSTSNQ